MHRMMGRKPSSQTGFTLLEVLIALLVLSIGLLGLAALQTVGLRSNQMAIMRTQVSHLGYEITDRMRSNPVGVDAGNYDTTIGFDLPTTQLDPICDELVPGTDTPCSPADMAVFDIFEWLTDITRLPNGDAQIVLDPGGSGRRTITIYWNESRDPGAGTVGSCPPADDTELRCYRLEFQG